MTDNDPTPDRTFVAGLAREFDVLWEETLSVLRDPPCPPPDWTPDDQVNPVAVLVRHIAERTLSGWASLSAADPAAATAPRSSAAAWSPGTTS